jgi:proteasome lid subunit RPN8/RPN11
MQAHAQATYPEECCGVILGKITPEYREVLEIHEAENSWTEEIGELLPLAGKHKKERFFIAPEFLLLCQKEARDRQLTILGFYHSHPDHPAYPSECDRLLAWVAYSYVILAVVKGEVTEILSWQLDEARQFQSEIIFFNISMNGDSS